MQNKLQVGIMGTGWVARMRHVPAYRRNNNVELVSVFNADPALAQSFASQQGIGHATSDLTIFLQQPTSLVSICTPPRTHFELAKACLMAGKHILLEKPVTMTTAEAAELATLAQEKGLRICPGHNFLFCRAMQRARKLMNEGTLGEVTGAMGIQWSSEKRPLPTWYKELPGGLFFDESPHLLYLLDYFLEDVQVQSAWRSKTPSVPGETLERFEARLQGNKGEGLLSMWFGAPMSEWLILISGTNGAFVIDIFRDVLVFFPPEKARTPQYLFEVLLRADRQIWSQMFRWVVTRYTRGSHLFGIDVLVNQFVESIRHDAPSPVAFSNGQKVVALITEILRLSDLRQ